MSFGSALHNARWNYFVVLFFQVLFKEKIGENSFFKLTHISSQVDSGCPKASLLKLELYYNSQAVSREAKLTNTEIPNSYTIYLYII